MKAIITGANGFIGCHMAKLLVAEGVETYCMVRKTSDLTLLKQLNPDLAGITLAYADVTDFASLKDTLPGMDLVFHLAGSVKAYDQVGFDKVNYHGTKNVLRACFEVNPGVQRIVIASSQAAAGPGILGKPATEDQPARPLPRDLYGISKFKAEFIARKYMDRLPIVITRPASVFGEGDVVSLDLFKSVKSGIKLRAIGGVEEYSVIDVDDLCAGFWACATNPAAVGETFFFTVDKVIKYEDLHEVVAKMVFGKSYGGLIPLRLPGKLLYLVSILMELVGKIQGEVPFINRTKIIESLSPAQSVSSAKAKAVLGWKASQTIPSMVVKAGMWYKEHGMI
jgi:nucleoside-diphosphate-sugar epimerase